MELSRAHKVRAAVAEQAARERTSVSVVHVCRAAAGLVAADGVGIGVIDPRSQVYEPVQAVGALGETLAELQATLGEGPGTAALREGRPVLVPDLRAGGTGRRWPLLAPAATAAGAQALFAFPLLAGKIAVGTLEFSRRQAGWLTRTQLADALLLADLALLQLLAETTSSAHDPKADRPDASAFMDRWPQVHQAAGMTSVHLGTDLAEAFARLRAHAFAHDRSLRQVADDVVAGRLVLGPSGRAGPASPPPSTDDPDDPSPGPQAGSR
ncbi:GAF and ANTAR domain-containing protein [Spirillospora sp. NPDC127200]